jgi:HlyD family secretion protein
MRRFFIAILVLIILSGIATALYEYYFGRKKDENKLILYGNVDVRQVDIGFRVAGQVKALFFEEGDFVKKDSLMAVLDESPYEHQSREAAANVKVIQANLRNAEILLKRRFALFPDGGVSKEDLNNAQSTYDQLVAQLHSSRFALDVALDNLRYIKAYAPTDGIILTRVREPGTVVREADPVYVLSVSSPVWIRAFVDEVHLGEVEFGMEAIITTDNPNGHSYSGKVGFISPVAEFTPKTVETTQLRTDLVYRLRIYVDHPDPGLRQGMPVTVTLLLRKREKAEKNE